MLRALAIVLAVVLGVIPASRWEHEAVAGQTWAVVVGESPPRRPPLIEALRRVSPSPYEHYAARAASRRLLASIVVLLAALAFA